MALDESGGGNMYMPVAPAYGYGGGGFGGFGGGDWGWIVLLLVLFGGFGGGWGGGGFDGLYPWMNNSQNINDGFRDQMLNTQLTSIGDRIVGGQMDAMQNTFGLQSQLSTCCCENRLATVQTQNIVAAEAAATRAAIQSQTQAILDKMCQDKIDAKNEKIVELNNKINSLEANNYIQNALTAQTQYFLGIYPPPAAAI